MNRRWVALGFAALQMVSWVVRAQEAAPRLATSGGASPDTVLSTMSVDGPDGRTYRFQYVAPSGWRFAGSEAARTAITLASASDSPAALRGLVEPRSPAVFVDEATGYRFVATKDGWSFDPASVGAAR